VGQQPWHFGSATHRKQKTLSPHLPAACLRLGPRPASYGSALRWPASPLSTFFGKTPFSYPRPARHALHCRPPPWRSRDQPMVFREFMMTLSDDVTPEAAKEAFSAYLANWWGDAIKAEFEQRKAEQG
jgi:hypothetical protein